MLTLQICITRSALVAMKTDLARALPDVKSSHRVEGLARGFGFRTYAALRAATLSGDAPIVTADGRAFTNYLHEHRFSVSEKCFYLAAGRAALQSVLRRTPNLGIHGIYSGRPERISSGALESESEVDARLVRLREELIEDAAIEEFLMSLAMLGHLQPTRTVRKDAWSYRLKEIAEKYSCTYPNGGKIGRGYVSNGSLIAAAIHAGFRYEICLDGSGRNSLNVYFNMSKREVDDLDCEIRPNHAFAESRRWRDERRKIEASLRRNYGLRRARLKTAM